MSYHQLFNICQLPPYHHNHQTAPCHDDRLPLADLEPGLYKKPNRQQLVVVRVSLNYYTCQFIYKAVENYGHLCVFSAPNENYSGEKQRGTVGVLLYT